MHLKSINRGDIHGASLGWANDFVLKIVIDLITVIFGVIIRALDKEVLVS